MFRQRIITLYTLRSVARPLLLSVSVGMIVLIIARLSIIVNLAVDKTDGVSIVLQMLSFWLPHYLSLCIPVSLFIGILLGFKRMVEDKEVDAMQACGLGTHQLFVPVAAMSVAIALVSVALFGWIEPHAKYAWKRLTFNLENNNVIMFVEDGTFMRIGNRTIMIENLNRRTREFGNFFMFEDRSEEGFSVSTAGRGNLASSSTDDQFYLRLNDVLTLQIAERVAFESEATAPRATVARAVSVDRRIDTAEKPYRPRGLNETEWTTTEILRAMLSSEAPIEMRYVRAEFHYRLAKFVLILLFPIFCFPFTLSVNDKNIIITYGIPIAIIVGLYLLLDHAKTLIKMDWPASLVMWVPIGVLLAVTFARYWRACFVVPHAR